MAEPRRIDVRGVRAEDVALDGVVDHLKGDGLVAYPTETVYGFGSCLGDVALRRLRDLKRREADKPILLLVPDDESVEDLAWTAEARELARIFWPGALTLVLSDPAGVFPEGVRSPTGTVAVRRTSHPLAARLVAALGAPLTSTSANAPGEPGALGGADAFDVAVGLGAGEEMLVLDAGPLDPSAPSTLVDCSGPTPEVLRSGATPVDRLRCVLPELR